MKKATLKLVIIFTAFFLFAGVAYSSWTDEVDVNVNAGTGVTELKVVDSYVVDGNSSKVDIERGGNRAKTEIEKLGDKEKIIVAYTLQNTGTIPVDIDNIKLYNMLLTSGLKNDAKNVSLVVELYYKGNRELFKKTDLSKASDNKKTINIKTNKNVRLASGEKATVRITLSYDRKTNDNNGKGNNKIKNNDGSKQVSFMFDLGIIYSRFNK